MADEPKIVADIRKIGGDQAVAIATALAAERFIVQPEDGPAGDKINVKGIETNNQIAAIKSLNEQLRTIMNAGVAKAAKLDADGVATFDDPTKAAIRDLNPSAVKLATSVGNNPNDANALKAFADAVVSQGVLQRLNEIPVSALQTPTAAPAVAPSAPGPRQP